MKTMFFKSAPRDEEVRITRPSPSSMKLGMTLARCTKLSPKARRILARAGFRRTDPLAINNRGGFNFIRFGTTAKMHAGADWAQLKGEANVVAWWITNVQWKRCSAETDAQWLARIII